VAVSVGVTGAGDSLGVSESDGGVVVFVTVTMTGVGEKMDGVFVGGGTGRVDIV
jgi:hypothetical protein